nr:hypothetical protein [Tanacetum cinerariifolium]
MFLIASRLPTPPLLWSLRDRIICDLNKTPDLFQEPPQNCPKLSSTSEPSNDNTNVVNALQDPFVVKQDPDKNSSQSLPQINHHCCYGCGDSLEDIFCHQCTCELCGKGAHYGYNCPPKVLIIPNPEPCNNQTIDELPQTLPSFDPTCYSEEGNSFTYDSKSNLVDDSPNKRNQIDYVKTFLRKFNRICFYEMPKVLSLAWETILEIEHAPEDKHLYINTSSWDRPTICYNDDDNEDCTIAITPILSIKEPDNSLSMGEEHLDTIPAMKSNEFIKSSVENLVPNLNSSIISSASKIDSLLDEFAGELTLLKLIPSGNNKTDCDLEEETRLIKKLLYDNLSPRPPEEFISENSDTAIESFSPSHISVKDSDSFMDILILEELLSNNSLSLPENELFHFDIPSSSRPLAKPPDGNSRILNVKVMGDISKHKTHAKGFVLQSSLPQLHQGIILSIRESSRRTKNDSVKLEVKAKQGLFGNPKSSYVQFVSFSPVRS